MTTTNILHSYNDGDFRVSIYSDGTKTRTGFGKATFPESMDVKITNWCDGACKWCHEGSTKRGVHGDLSQVTRLIKQLPSGVEIAIGGGHPLAHPSFDNFVTELSSIGIICNVTINEKHFADCLPRIERLIEDKKIIGVGYSYNTRPCLWKYEHLVSHVIIGVSNRDELKNIVSVNNKVLLLGYKDFGRGSKYTEDNGIVVTENISSWYRGLFSAARDAHLSFDNLAIKQLKPERLLSDEDYESFYMGNDGSHSMYIDAVKNEYGINSTSVKRMQFKDSIRDMFSDVS